ncbi:MAG: WYL domain-containing protein [Tissierellia bacterium]|jgi:predicted DNA-binding transcriptional regulator YafY|nr:WYL domain-containing protein [Tissierellia bacterium]
MSKISNALNMYFLLMSRPIMSGDELARELEVSKRMINDYKQDLEMAGIYIGSKPGVGGGYYLEKGINLSQIHLNEEEKDALRIVKTQMEASNQAYATAFETLASKILSITEQETFQYLSKTTTKPMEDRLREEKLFVSIRKAVNEQIVIEIEYLSVGPIKRELTKRIIEPYNTFTYKKSLYLAAYCTEKKDFRYFKLSRINSLRLTEEKFKRESGFSLEEMMVEGFGIYREEAINVKLKIRYPSSVFVEENIFVENQTITTLDDGILFEARMKGSTEIETWILSMGENVTVLEPMELKLRLRDRIRKALVNI